MTEILADLLDLFLSLFFDLELMKIEKESQYRKIKIITLIVFTALVFSGIMLVILHYWS